MGLLEVELVRKSNLALDMYREAYNKRYGIVPVFSASNVEQVIIKDLLKLVEFDELSRCIDMYLKMDGENNWYVTKGHNLSALKADINVLRALAKPKVAPDHSGTKITVWFSCDKCEQRKLITVPLRYNWDRATWCDECTQTQNFELTNPF